MSQTNDFLGVLEDLTPRLGGRSEKLGDADRQGRCRLPVGFTSMLRHGQKPLMM